MKPQDVEDRPSGRKLTRRIQLGCLVRRGSVGKEGTPAMSIPLELCPKEEHNYHLQTEADREPLFILCPGDTSVKGEQVKEKMPGGLFQHLLDHIVIWCEEGMRGILGGFEAQGEFLVIGFG